MLSSYTQRLSPDHVLVTLVPITHSNWQTYWPLYERANDSMTCSVCQHPIADGGVVVHNERYDYDHRSCGSPECREVLESGSVPVWKDQGGRTEQYWVAKARATVGATLWDILPPKVRREIIELVNPTF